MPLYNNKVIKAQGADEVALDHKAQDIRTGFTKELLSFEKSQEQAKVDFKMDPLLSKITGHAIIRDEKIKTEVEKLALNKLKEIEEKAYKEAYDLGVKEGREQGVKDAQEMIEDKIFQLEKEIEYILSLRTRLLEHNEAKILEMIFGFASRLAMKEIQKDDSYIIEVLKKLVHGIQEDLETVVKISTEDFQFIEQMNKEFTREVKLPKNAKLEAGEELKRGDCIVETNYGVVDASLDARITKLWNLIDSNTPKNDEDIM